MSCFLDRICFYKRSCFNSRYIDYDKSKLVFEVDENDNILCKKYKYNVLEYVLDESSIIRKNQLSDLKCIEAFGIKFLVEINSDGMFLHYMDYEDNYITNKIYNSIPGIIYISVLYEKLGDETILSSRNTSNSINVDKYLTYNLGNSILNKMKDLDKLKYISKNPLN